MSPSLAHLAELHAAMPMNERWTVSKWDPDLVITEAWQAYNDDNAPEPGPRRWVAIKCGSREIAAAIVALHNVFPDLLAEFQAAETLIGEEWTSAAGTTVRHCPWCSGLNLTGKGHYPGCERADYFEARRKREEAKPIG